jgi:uncharacterized membrane protein
MRDPLNTEVARWVSEGLIEQMQADRIRAFEASRGSGISWPVRLALLFGVVMLGAGLLLFVSAHWDELSPSARFAVVIGALGALHVSAAAAIGSALRTALHAAGTVALGGAIFLAGQIFNLEERWSSGILLWAIGAAVGWRLLDDAPQLAFTAILGPVWLVSEWIIITERDMFWAVRVAAVGIFLLVVAYLTADAARSPRRAAVLRWLGAAGLLPAGAMLWAAAVIPIIETPNRPAGAVSPGWLVLGWTIALVLPTLVAFAMRGGDAWLNAVALAWAVAAVNLFRVAGTLVLFAWFGLAAIALTVWGIRESHPARINIGTAAFGLIVIGFYFSAVMDRLGRSASLIVFGVLFLAGGFTLEKARRSLVQQVAGRTS